MFPFEAVKTRFSYLFQEKVKFLTNSRWRTCWETAVAIATVFNWNLIVVMKSNMLSKTCLHAQAWSFMCNHLENHGVEGGGDLPRPLGLTYSNSLVVRGLTFKWLRGWGFFWDFIKSFNRILPIPFQQRLLVNTFLEMISDMPYVLIDSKKNFETLKLFWILLKNM